MTGGPTGRTPGGGRVAATVALAVLAGTVPAACGSGSGGGVAAYSNADPANTRRAEGPIDSSTVDELEVAWTLPLTAGVETGPRSSSPVISDGVVYWQDPDSNVRAIDLRSGRVLWTRRYDLPNRGPNGVTVADGRLFGATPTTAFALELETGEPLWSKRLTDNRSEAIEMAPGYDEGRVFVSTASRTTTGTPPPGAAGVLWALDAASGEELWTFRTVPSDLWGNPDLNSAGGLRHPPAFDGEGSLYFNVVGTTVSGELYALDSSGGRVVWRQDLPAGAGAGTTVSGDTFIVPAGLASAAGQTPQLVAYRLGGRRR